MRFHFPDALQRAVVLVVALVLVALAANPGLAGSHEEGRLLEQPARLAEVREQVAATEDAVALSAQELARVQAQPAMVVEAVRAAEESVLRSQQAVADAAGRLEVGVVEQDEQRRVAGDHAAERYMRGGDLSVQAVLTADTAAEVLDQSLYLEADARSDRQSGRGRQMDLTGSGFSDQEFGPRWGRLHAGIDIAAPNGTPIYAAQAGCVSFAGVQGGYGNLILIDHGGGTVTAYAHQSRLGASKGECVSTGQQIGAVGSTGNSTGNHLHFEVRVSGSARNPRPYLP